MAVTWGAAGTAASGTTSCTPAYPTGISALTSKILCAVTGRSNTADSAFTMPAGWTKIGASELEGGTGTWGVDTGTRRVTFFQKDTTAGTETGTVTVSLAGTTNNTLRATIFRVEVTSGYGIAYEATTGADTTNGTGFSATGGSISFAPDDLLAILVAQNIDTGTQSSQAISATGVTFGTRTNRASTAVTNGNDHRHILDTVPMSSGTTTAAPTYSYTISAAGSGPVAFLRMREVAPPVVTSEPTNEFVIDGGDASFTLSGTGYDSVKWQELIVGEGGDPPVAAGFSNVALPNTQDSGNVSVTIPSGTNAYAVFGTYYDGANSAIASFTGSSLTPTGLLTSPSSGSMGAYLAYGQVTATGSQTVRLQKTSSGYSEGPTCQVAWLTVDDPTSFFLDAECVGDTSGAITRSVDSTASSLVIGWVGSDGGGTLGSISGYTQQGSEQVTNSDKGRVYTADTPGDPTTSLTGPSNSFPTLGLFSAVGGGGSTWTDVSGATTTTLGLTGVTTADDGRKFRGVLTNTAGSTTTVEVTLYVSADGLVEYLSETTGGVEVAATSANVGAISLVEGDLDLLIIGAGVVSGDAPAITTPAGWTKADEATDLPLATVVNTTLCVFWRNSLGSAAGFTVSADASSLWGWTRIAYRFQDPSDPIEATVLGHLAASTAHVLPGYTATKDEHAYIGWISQAIAQGATVPSPMVRRVNDEAGGIVLGEEQISADGATGTRTFTVSSSADTIYAVVGLNSLASDAGGSGQTLSPGLGVNTSSFYGPTITTGAVTVSPGLGSNTNTFFGPTVSRGTVTLTPGLATNTSTFYSPSVSTSYTITPGLSSNSQTFYDPTISVGGVELSPELADNENTFFDAVVSQGGAPQELQPGLAENQQTFYGPTVSTGSVTLSPELAENEQQFYGPSVSVGSVTLSPGLAENTNTFFDATLTVGSVLEPALLVNEQTFYSPEVTTGEVEILPPLLTNQQTFYGPTVNSGTVVSPPFFENESTFFDAEVVPGEIVLQPQRLENEQTFFSASIVADQILLPELLVNTNVFYPAVVLDNIWPDGPAPIRFTAYVPARDVRASVPLRDVTAIVPRDRRAIVH